MDREPVGHIQITLMNKEVIPTHFMELSVVKKRLRRHEISNGSQGFRYI